MNVLVFNSGSSSVKFQLINVEFEKVLKKGMVDGINLPTCKVVLDGVEQPMAVANHVDAINWVFSNVDLSSIQAIGHRVVHGGEHYPYAVAVDDNVINTIRELSSLAPLHNPHNLAGIIACRDRLKSIPQVAVFDTAFHQTIPPVAYLYGIPYSYYEKHRIRKYGFHGTSHKYLVLKASQILKKKNLNLITCHLGNGSSITAIKEGKSVDTSMGLTPLPGVLMGTRCGDIDPSVYGHLATHENLSIQQIDEILNKKSGYLGICGYSDVRTIHQKADAGDEKCRLVLDMLAYDIVSYIGSYAVLLGRVDAIIFTAGIGQGAFYLREAIAKALAPLGVKLEKAANRHPEKNPIISTKDSKIKYMVIPTNEELMIALETKQVLEKAKKKKY